MSAIVRLRGAARRAHPGSASKRGRAPERRAAGEIAPTAVKRLYAPRDGMELMLLRSLLDASDVPYFVHNEHFGALEIGPRIDHFNARTIMVSEEAYPAAEEVLRQFLSDRGVERRRPPRRAGPWDALRMALEVLLFGWIVPGRSRRRDPSSRWTVHDGGGREPER